LQEFDVDPTRTVREEFSSVYKAQLRVVAERERISKELEGVGEDMAKMQVRRFGGGQVSSGAWLWPGDQGLCQGRAVLRSKAVVTTNVELPLAWSIVLLLTTAAVVLRGVVPGPAGPA
jgi:hypothetical protein